MNKKNYKVFISIVAVFTLCTTAISANEVLEKISATIAHDITISFNGIEQTLKDAKGNITAPIIYNGTTYLPIRSIGDILGIDTTWDNEARTVKLKQALQYNEITPAPTQTTAPKPSITPSPVYAINQDIRIGNTVVKVLSIDKAADIAHEGGSTTVASDGHIFYAISIEVETTDKPTSGRYWFANTFITSLYTADDIRYEMPFSFEGSEVYPGVKTRATVYIQVLNQENIKEIEVSGTNWERVRVVI